MIKAQKMYIPGNLVVSSRAGFCDRLAESMANRPRIEFLLRQNYWVLIEGIAQFSIEFQIQKIRTKVLAWAHYYRVCERRRQPQLEKWPWK